MKVNLYATCQEPWLVTAGWLLWLCCWFLLQASVAPLRFLALAVLPCSSQAGLQC